MVHRCLPLTHTKHTRSMALFSRELAHTIISFIVFPLPCDRAFIISAWPVFSTAHTHRLRHTHRRTGAHSRRTPSNHQVYIRKSFVIQQLVVHRPSIRKHVLFSHSLRFLFRPPSRRNRTSRERKERDAQTCWMGPTMCTIYVQHRARSVVSEKNSNQNDSNSK